MERVETKISRDLMEAVRKRAREEGRDSSEIIEEAVSRYLQAQGTARSPRDLKEVFDSIDRYRRERGVEPLSEEEAMRLAVEEQHAWRHERREEGRR